ncbi:hypothetical protein IQ238_11050 [Pleurocapsales cyanobacterium LEGE 06147]|nr:hypothetical protein [Pleurocapsales cyanobacterium LEGE 06147]
MSRRKKKFSCGHKGYGRVCHRCVQKELEASSEHKLESNEASLSVPTLHPQLTRNNKNNSEWEKKRQHKLEWEAAFARDPIDLRNLPKNVVIKSRRIIERLQIRSDYRQFHGKRLRHDRFVISIPVTRNYRLICRDCGNLLVPEAVVSHEDYNVVKPGR